jgi:hypothetical protein|tara:strand:- start:391 stop:606 length:216 start_codon:yes stop_codon:yes gene_type:complete
MKPLIIEIRFATHTYTATVRDLRSLEKYLSGETRKGNRFQFGSILSYGGFDLHEIAGTMNQVRCLSGYGLS